MAKKGSITVFLALILGLIVSLLSSGLESVRMASARTQILNGLDIGLYSLFGQYEKSLLKDYDLFAIDGSTGGKELNLAAVYDELESYMKPVLKQNSQKLSVQQGGISGYQLLTDMDGEVFYQQVVQYMKETLGPHGAQLLLEKMKTLQKKTEDAEQKGTEIENKGTLESYESEMDTARQNSQAALEEKKKMEEQKKQESGFTDGKMLPSVTDSADTDKKELPAKVENPIPIIRRIRWMGILDVVLPADAEVSNRKIKKRELVSGRTLKTGLAMEDAIEEDGSLLSQILYQQYLMEKLGNYRNPKNGGLSYQIEYILSGKDSDEANLKSMANKLLLVREGINVACLMADNVKMAEVQALAAAIAASFLIPPAAVIIEGALVLCWAFAESILDVQELFAGGKVPIIKDASNWQLSLQSMPALMEKTDSERKNDETGLSYEDYLQVFLLAKAKGEKIMRGMDMVESSIQEKENWNTFQMDHCITALEASVDVRANKRKTFTVERAYHYL